MTSANSVVNEVVKLGVCPADHMDAKGFMARSTR